MTKEFIQEQLSRGIIEALPIALMVLDHDLRVIMTNRSLSSFLAIENGEGKEISELIPDEGLKRRLREVQQEGGPKEVELHMTLRNGSFKVFKAIIVGLNRGVAVETFSLVLLEDISEKIRLEQQLVQSEKLAGMGQLAASIAHELGNPLSIMSATLQYMQQRLHEKNDTLAQEMEIILDNVNEMHVLLKSLSEFTGPERPHFEYLDIHQSLSQMLAFVAKDAEGRKVTIEADFKGHLPTWADHRKLKQVFLNLFKNALEAMPGGGRVWVKTRLVPEAFSKKSGIMIQISDTGVGISQEEINFIFRPFYSTKKGGTGLGLSFCRRVIEEHGGEITVESQIGRGTTFTILLPLKREGERDGQP